MTTARYPKSCTPGSQDRGEAWAPSCAWIVNFNNGNANNNHRNNNACVRAVRSVPAGEYQGMDDSLQLLQDLHAAWRAARSGKKPSANQLAFDGRWADGLLQLQREIEAGTWHPRPSTCFVATRPKAREIHAPDFADRVVHHWLVPQLEAIWEPRFIAASFANRKGKGSHAAVRHLQHHVRQVASGQDGGYYLQLDIRNYFNCIHCPTLWAIMKPVLACHHVPLHAQRVTHALLRQHPLHAGVTRRGTASEFAQVPQHKRLENAAPGCGLPIGNLSSQLFANIYLDRLDQFVKHTLKAKRYVRYVDDFVLVHHDRDVLARWKTAIEQFLRRELRLQFKDAGRLQPLGDGIDFLGYVIRPSHTLVRRRVVVHARAALAEWERAHVFATALHATPRELQQLQSTLASYAGHLRHASSFRLRQALHRRFPWLHAATRRRRFHHSQRDQRFIFRVPERAAA